MGTPTTMEDLEKILKNCKHGGPDPAEQNEPWFVATESCMRTMIPMIDVLHPNSPGRDIVKLLQQTEDILSGDDFFESRTIVAEMRPARRSDRGGCLHPTRPFERPNVSPEGFFAGPYPERWTWEQQEGSVCCCCRGQ
jgi:hypothetical protein